ncbi:MAG: hypothetical protein ABL930_11165, partial [Pseudobdellovibrio sp.]
ADAKPNKISSRKPSSVERPPQFVLLGFDGSSNLDFWTESVDFADTVKTNNPDKENKVKFTYFINPTYYTDPAYKSNYQTPGLDGKSVSCIGWADKRENIPLRVERTNNAFVKGNEIASHANSHCDASGTDKNNPLYGRPYSFENWSSEFEQFNKLLFGVFSLNKFPEPKDYAPTGLAFKESDVVGFRAPLLAVTDGLWPTLKKFNFRYDTSKVSSPTYWPQKQTWGGWNFPLAQIKIAGTSRTTLSMDYNWLVYHSAGASKPNLTAEEREGFRQQMLDSYKYYFKVNYFGNRAPVHIGHHFSKWNQGAYWQAMKEFSQFVCNKPEVRCVTYTEYANWLDSVDEATMKAYRAADFEKPAEEGIIKDIAVPVLADVRIDTDIKGFEAIADSRDLNKIRSTGARVQLQINFEGQRENSVTRGALINKYGKGSHLTLRAALLNKNGKLIHWSTYKLTNLGLPNENISEPIENLANQPETAEAHNTPE